MQELLQVHLFAELLSRLSKHSSVLPATLLEAAEDVGSGETHCWDPLHIDKLLLPLLFERVRLLVKIFLASTFDLVLPLSSSFLSFELCFDHGFRVNYFTFAAIIVVARLEAEERS